MARSSDFVSTLCFDLAFLDERRADARPDRAALAEVALRLRCDPLAFVEREVDFVEREVDFVEPVAFVERPAAFAERAVAFVEPPLRPVELALVERVDRPFELAFADPPLGPFELAFAEPRALGLLLRAFDAEFLPDAFSLPA